MMEHPGEEKIALLAGGDLPAGEMSEAADHAARCESCAAMLESYRRDRVATAALRTAGLDGRDFAEVRQAVLRRLPEAGRPRFDLFGRLGWAVLAAGLMAAAVIGIRPWKNATPPRSGEKTARTGPAPKVTIQPEVQSRVNPAAEPAAAWTVAKSERGRAAQVFAPGRTGVAPVPSTPATVQDDVAIWLETSDPNVIIIWLASPKGEGR